MSSLPKRLLWIGAALLVGFCASTLLSLRDRVRTGGREEVEEFLATTPLRPLPVGASNVLLHSWSGPVTGETHVRFELNPADLAAFVSNRPALASAKPVGIYDREHPLLPPPRDPAEFRLGQNYSIRSSSAPDWAVPAIPGKGRAYFLWPNAWLHLDEERGIVWLKVVKG